MYGNGLRVAIAAAAILATAATPQWRRQRVVAADAGVIEAAQAPKPDAVAARALGDAEPLADAAALLASSPGGARTQRQLWPAIRRETPQSSAAAVALREAAISGVGIGRSSAAGRPHAPLATPAHAAAEVDEPNRAPGRRGPSPEEATMERDDGDGAGVAATLAEAPRDAGDGGALWDLSLDIFGLLRLLAAVGVIILAVLYCAKQRTARASRSVAFPERRGSTYRQTIAKARPTVSSASEPAEESPARGAAARAAASTA